MVNERVLARPRSRAVSVNERVGGSAAKPIFAFWFFDGTFAERAGCARCAGAKQCHRCRRDVSGTASDRHVKQAPLYRPLTLPAMHRKCCTSIWGMRLSSSQAPGRPLFRGEYKKSWFTWTAQTGHFRPFERGEVHVSDDRSEGTADVVRSPAALTESPKRSFDEIWPWPCPSRDQPPTERLIIKVATWRCRPLSDTRACEGCVQRPT